MKILVDGRRTNVIYIYNVDVVTIQYTPFTTSVGFIITLHFIQPLIFVVNLPHICKFTTLVD